MKSRFLATLVALSLTAVLAAAPAGATNNEWNPNTKVSNEAELIAAVDAANANPNIGRILFELDAVIELTDEVRYTGAQDLKLYGRGATLSGATTAPDTDTWDSGLFVSESGGNLSVFDLTFADSFNNGLAVFVPAGGDDVKVKLTRVEVSNAQFHGVLIDGQATTGYNTDDFIHPNCVDPYPTNAGVDIEIVVRQTSILGAGQLSGYDISQATGCPQDFDGLRVDQGGDGDLNARLIASHFDGNLADGAELDEKGEGSVTALATRSTFNNNGDTVAIVCTVAAECGDDLGEEVEDLDDGFDIDEEDGGDLNVIVKMTQVNDNKDEGMDMDEAGDGSIVAVVKATEASRNGDEGYKASEADAGDNTASLIRSTFVGAGNDQIEVESEDGDGTGTVNVFVKRITSTGAEGSGVKAVEDDGGAVFVKVLRSTITGNGEWGVEAEGGSGDVEVYNSDLSGNTDGEVELDI